MSNSSGGQQLIRQVNNSIYEVFETLGFEDGEFWCECADIGCEERILLTLREYAALQQRSGILLARAHGRLPELTTYDC
jgi:hypothetical protein